MSTRQPAKVQTDTSYLDNNLKTLRQFIKIYCIIHCYKPEYREKIQQLMQYSSKRFYKMLFTT